MGLPPLAEKPKRIMRETTPEMARKAAEGLMQGLSPRQALKAAGYGPATVNAGRRRIGSKAILAELRKLGHKYIEMGRKLTPEEQEALVRGRLYENVIVGSDQGVQSAKQLGADKRVAMWQPDSQVGLVVLQPPPIPKIDHDVPLLEPKFIDDDEEEDPKKSS
jgi:hypothetical protein